MQPIRRQTPYVAGLDPEVDKAAGDMRHDFMVRGVADPQTLPRVLGHLTRRWLMPIKLASEIVGSEVRIEFQIAGLSQETAGLIAETLRESVLVHETTLKSAPVDA